MGERERHIVIIGGGVIGVCAAHELALRGERVTLLERDEIGGACSYGNAGLYSFGHPPIPQPGLVRRGVKMMLDSNSPLYIAPRPDPALLAWLWRFRKACSRSVFERNMKITGALSHASLGLFEEYADRYGVSYDLARKGYLEVCISEKGLAEAEETARQVRSIGIEAETLSRAETLRREPGLTNDVVGAVWYPQSVSGNPHKFVTGIAALAEQEGAVLRREAEVESIETAGGRARGVTLVSGEAIEADEIVLAAGVWSSRLARDLNLRIPMQPAKGYHRDVDHPDPPLTISCLFHEASMACTPMGEFLRLAGTLEFSGFDERMRRNRLEMLTEAGRRFLVGMNGAAPRSEWVGMRPVTADGMPVIGPAPTIENVFLATGHGMLGMSFGPVTGKLTAQALCGESPGIDLAPLGAARF